MILKNCKLGISPIAWSNDDMHELGADISFEQCINEMAIAGYQGCEVGHKFPRDPKILQQALSPYGLKIASAWYSLYFTETDRYQETLDGFTKHMKFLKAMDAKVIVVCECGHSIHGLAIPLFGHSPIFSATKWKDLINGLHQIGQLAKTNNMKIVYHHHLGTGIERFEDISYLMNETDPELVSLLLDTGHLACSGSDAMMLLEKYGERIKHVHLKDFRNDVLQCAKTQQLSFLDAVKAGLFTVPSDGSIDFKPIFKKLIEIDYQGWCIIEAEQDPNLADPFSYAIKARTFWESQMDML